MPDYLSPDRKTSAMREHDDIKALDLGRATGPQLTPILREMIIGNRFKANERLSEAEISQLFTVSRQPVRESFIKLAEEGLLEIRPQRGTFVRPISLRAVENARFIREAIEADLVRILSVNVDKALAVELGRQLDAQAALVEKSPTAADRAEFRRLDDLFHATLAERAGRAHLWHALSGVKSQMDRVRHLTLQTLEIARLVDQHRVIAEAILKGDSAAAETAIRRHLRVILSDLTIHLEKTPQLFDHAESGWRDILQTPLHDPE